MNIYKYEFNYKLGINKTINFQLLSTVISTYIYI